MIYKITEMPHFETSSHRLYDVQLENHMNDTEEDFIAYMKDFIYNSREPKVVKKELLKNDVFLMFVNQKYGQATLAKIMH